MPDTQITDEMVRLAAIAIAYTAGENIMWQAYVGQARAALEAALSGHVVGWRTMDSAPKDGTHFLAIYGDDDDGTYWILFWNGKFFECVSAGYQVDHATHWTNLPTPPVPVEPNPTAGAS